MDMNSTSANRTINQSEVGSEKSQFVAVVLPWVVALGALVVYLATLNPWLSFNNLLSVAKTSGWTWQPELIGPVCWLLMWPLRKLPPQAIPVAVNLFSTVCAVLTLALLARSVALLPHDRTQEQRERERSPFGLLSTRSAWLPPVLAVVVLGLQLTFWEDATAASGQMADLTTAPFANHCEMLDLLLFAYVIRCLLEFRISDRQSWLSRAALVYGLAMTGNWAMIALLPLFVIAVMRIKGLNFFNGRFLGRMTLWGLAGLSFYFLLPAVQSVRDISKVPFWPALSAELGQQKGALSLLHVYFSYWKEQALLLAVTSLVPVFLIGIRWTSHFGDISRVGIWLTNLTFQVVQGVLLGACIWVALDPKLSPRNSGFAMPCFTLFYLGALAVGYLSGYFLLVHGRRSRLSRRPAPLTPLNRCIVLAVWLLLPTVTALLVWRNLPQIRMTNGPMLKQYASHLAQTLPPKGAILLSDDARQLVLLHSYLTQNAKDRNYLFVDTQSLQVPEYHRFLSKQYSTNWPVDMPRDVQQLVRDRPLMGVIYHLSASNSVYYLHPSFGYYFEVFDTEPHGLTCKLTRCHTNTLMAPRLSGEVLAENGAFWARADQAALKPLAKAISAQRESETWLDRLLDRLYLKKLPNRDATILASFYARALNNWAVQAQRQGELAQAATWLRCALELRPENPVFLVNLDCNKSLQAKSRLTPPRAESVEGLLNQYRRWDNVLNANGPFDEPTYCYQQGLEFVKGRLYRQAAQNFARSSALAPDEVLPRLWLARMDILRGLPDDALDVLKDIHDPARKMDLARTNLIDLVLVESATYLTKGEVKEAESSVQWALDKDPGDEVLLTTAMRVYLSYGIVSNAVACIEAALAKRPEDENLLVMASQVYLSAQRYTNALASINAAIKRHPADDLAKQFMLATAAQIQMNAGLYSNAIVCIERQLKLNPNNPQALASEGYACLQLGAFDQAVNFLTKAINMETNNTPDLKTYARLNRAVTYLRSNNLDQAKRDYETLQKTFPSAYPVYFGLQEIAYRRKDTNAAIHYIQLYLTNSPPENEAKSVRDRLKELRPGSD